MSREDENLFSGLEIMSPEDMIKSNETTERETSEETTSDEIENSDELTISTPVPSGESETANINSKGSDDNDEPSVPPSKNVYSAFIKEMVGAGVISGPEEEAELEELLKDASVDTIKELMAKTVEKNVNVKQDEWKRSLSSEKKKFLELENDFDDTNSAIQLAQRIDYLDSLDNATISGDVNIQANLYYEDLKLKGFSHEDAVEAIDEAKALNKLEEKALKSLPSIKEYDSKLIEKTKESSRIAREKLQKDNEDAFNGLMSSIDKTESLVDGLKLTSIAKEKLKNNITTPVYEDKQGRKYTSLMYKQMKSPSEFDKLINYYDTLGLFNLDKDGNFKPDMTKLKGVAKTAASSELEAILSSEASGVGQRTSVTQSKETSSILDFLERATGQNKRKK
jgi:hypothetical protein